MKGRLKILLGFITPSGWMFKKSSPRDPGLGRKVLAGWNSKVDRALKNYNLVKTFIATEKRKITIIRFVEEKKKFIKDDVNLREGCKPLIDGLVRARLLYHDDTDWLDDKDGYRQEVGTPPRTEVTIEW